MNYPGENHGSSATFANMDVQQLIEMQQRGIAQLQEATGYAQRRIELESRMVREQQRLWEMERRATSAIVETVQELARRPFDSLISRMEQESRGFQHLTNHLTGVATANAALESIRIGETIRKLAEPIPALKTVLPNPIVFSTLFDAARVVKPLLDLQTQIGILTSNSVAESVRIGSVVASTVGDTIRAISAVVNAAHPHYLDNPLFGSDSLASSYADLSEVVDYGRENFADPGFEPYMEAILAEIRGLRADGAKEKLARVVLLWAAILTLLIQAADYYNRHVSEYGQCKSLPPVQQQPAVRPTEHPEANDAGPCP